MASRDRPSLSLLLLPSTSPSLVSYKSLRGAYGPALSDALVAVGKTPNATGNPAILDIALPCLEVSRFNHLPRSQVYRRVQRVLAEVYKLICVICAKKSIEAQGPDGVDTRVILLSWQGDEHAIEDVSRTNWNLQGPVINLATLASSQRPWQILFSVDDQRGEHMLQQFNRYTAQLGQAQGWKLETVKGGEYTISTEADQPKREGDDVGDSARRHTSVAVGGTFDHLHAGHKLLLTMTAFLLEPVDFSGDRMQRLIVGISGDELLQKKQFLEYISPWTERQGEVLEFVASIINFTPDLKPRETSVQDGKDIGHRTVMTRITPSFTLECVEIADPYGPTVTDESISALVVSAETRSGGRAVNAKREEKDWASLEVFEVDVLDTEDEARDASTTFEQDFAGKISSTEIRRRMNEKKKKAEEMPWAALMHINRRRQIRTRRPLPWIGEADSTGSRLAPPTGR